MSAITILIDWIAASLFRSQTNTNFANLNTDKVEWPASSSDWEVVLFNSTTGKIVKRSNTLTGLYKLVSWVFTTAINSDLPVMTSTVWGAVPTPPNNTTTFLRWDGTFATPSGSGDMVLASTQTVSGLKTFLAGMFALRNVANTFSGFFTNTNTADRTYTLQNRNGTLADDTDLATKATLAGSISQAFSVSQLEVGNASDTTLSRVSAGKIAVEGVNVGTEGILQNSQSVAYTTVLSDAGKHIYHPSADTTARIWTIDSNANVAYPIGTAITFINDTGAGTITIAITTDTLVLAGAGTTGSRTLTANWIATAVKKTATSWIINWTNLT